MIDEETDETIEVSSDKPAKSHRMGIAETGSRGREKLGSGISPRREEVGRKEYGE